MTHLQGPYDDIHSTNKTRLQCVIPTETYEKWFSQSGAFPLRGTQDKVLARLFHLLDSFLTRHKICQDHNLLNGDTSLDNEKILNQIMSEINIPDEITEQIIETTDTNEQR